MVIFRRREVAHNVLNLFTLNYLLLPIVTCLLRTTDQEVTGSNPVRRVLILLDLRKTQNSSIFSNQHTTNIRKRRIIPVFSGSFISPVGATWLNAHCSIRLETSWEDRISGFKKVHVLLLYRWIARIRAARFSSVSASSSRFIARYSLAEFSRHVATSGWSGPHAFSMIASSRL